MGKFYQKFFFKIFCDSSIIVCGTLLQLLLQRFSLYILTGLYFRGYGLFNIYAQWRFINLKESC